MEQVVSNFKGDFRSARLNGREYLVAPLSLIVPGVLAGSRGPLLYPPEEVSKDPASWNHVPIVVEHPMLNGKPVSGRDPDVLSSSGIGYVFKSRINNNGKLVAEGWFDLEKVRAVSPIIYQKLLANEQIELSTGLFTDNVPTSGVHNGRPYHFVARNYRPDHLAILQSTEGACSLRDGCGVGVINKKKKINLSSPDQHKRDYESSLDRVKTGKGMKEKRSRAGKSGRSGHTGRSKIRGDRGAERRAKTKQEYDRMVDIQKRVKAHEKSTGGGGKKGKDCGAYGRLCKNEADCGCKSCKAKNKKAKHTVKAIYNRASHIKSAVGGSNCGIAAGGFQKGNVCAKGGVGVGSKLKSILGSTARGVLGAGIGFAATSIGSGAGGKLGGLVGSVVGQGVASGLLGKSGGRGAIGGSLASSIIAPKARLTVEGFNTYKERGGRGNFRRYLQSVKAIRKPTGFGPLKS